MLLRFLSSSKLLDLTSINLTRKKLSESLQIQLFTSVPNKYIFCLFVAAIKYCL